MYEDLIEMYDKILPGDGPTRMLTNLGTVRYIVGKGRLREVSEEIQSMMDSDLPDGTMVELAL